jgi:hypothetical protein
VISLFVEGVLEQEQPEAMMIGFCFSFYHSADQRSHGMAAATGARH